MDHRTNLDGHVVLVVNADELLTLRHCVVEALEALGDREFLVRTGGTKRQAEEVLAALKRASTDIRTQDES
ncbi:MAG: hypothetical protein ACRCY9_10330 [Phycicoccus sp.]